MLHAGAYYPPVDTTWNILTTGASQLTAGALCTHWKDAKKLEENSIQTQ